MNTIEWAMLTATGLAAIGVLAAVTLPSRQRPAVVGTATMGVGTAGLVAGIAALTGTASAAHLPWLLPLAGVDLAVDPLGGLFMAVTGAVVALAAGYGIGYCAGGHGPGGRAVQALLPLFGWSMLMVPAAASVPTLLVTWELMAVTSLLLVLAEHRARVAVVAAGRWYAAMTQFGFVAILLGGVCAMAAADGGTFAALRAAHPSPAMRGLIFGLLLLGFGAKAGLVPVHVWLPRAHPEAPTQVSAMLSAAMVNLGVYGVVRFGFDLLGGGSIWWWLLVLAAGSASALLGILQAAMASDLKRLLAYSTVENMGLIFVGIGAAGLLRASGAPVLAAVAMSAALLHVINHAGFKVLLFFGAGSVLRATGSRDLDSLGGLRPRMPVTTALFAVGALAAAALPPGNGFVSEWLLLQSLLHAVPTGGVLTAVAIPVAVAVVALTAGLAMATFVKAVGVGFFARPRSDAAARATESPVAMLIAMGLAAAAGAAAALAPTALAPALGAAVSTATGAPRDAVTGGVTMRLDSISSTLSPLLVALALAAGVAIAAAVARLASARVGRRRAAPLWDCGAGAPTARMQYTATSFAEPLQRVFDGVLDPDTGVEVTPYAESRYLLARIAYRRRVPDRVEQWLYQPLARAGRGRARLGPVLANGSVHRYLSYGFVGVTGLLVILAVTR
jgi:formate hydrogenlyase subunit 3/multisubunit Na+/H+ antiporter MnhD subunit